MWSQLKGYWDEVKEQVPHIYDQISGNVSQHLSPLIPAIGGGNTAETIPLGDRTLRIVKKIGEGGYSFVYLAEEVHPPPNSSGTHSVQMFALKKILAAGVEQLCEAQREVDVMRCLSHPNLLPLLDFTIIPAEPKVGSGVTHILYMLFPLYVSF